MEYTWVALLAATIIAVVVVFMCKSRMYKSRFTSSNICGQKGLLVHKPFSTNLENSRKMELNIPIELLPSDRQPDEKKLFEITDNMVISRISQTIPAAAQIATRTATNSALKSMEVYRAVLPSGETLVKSKNMAGAVRGFSRSATGIKSQANLVKLDVSATTALANGVANVMNIGSFVVGQYYMTQISSKLDDMSRSISKITDFQNRAFKSRILSVITLVGEISQFSSEIVTHDDQRNQKLVALDGLKATTTELLGQINITICETIQNNQSLDYKGYQSAVNDFGMLVSFQNAMVTVLEEISKLTYLLGRGTISIEQCYASFEKYKRQSIQDRSDLRQWHERQAEILHIELEKERKAKDGLEAIVFAIPGLFDERYKYHSLSHDFVCKICDQANAIPNGYMKPHCIYHDDVEIIIKDGKYFYLPKDAGNNQELTE